MKRVPILLIAACLMLVLAPAVARAGIVTGHVYAYDGSPVAGAEVIVADSGDQGGEWEWVEFVATEASGLYTLSGAPATTHGALYVLPEPESEQAPIFVETGVTFADPGTTTIDVWPGAISWSVARGGPWARSWREVGLATLGRSEAGAWVWASGRLEGVAAEDVVTGSSLALPADLRWFRVSFSEREAFVWDAADPGNSPIPVAAGSTTVPPFTVEQALARRICFTNSYWRSGKPGTVLRVALDNFPAGTVLRFRSEMANVHPRWADYTSTGPERQIVRLTVPAKTWPGYALDVNTTERTPRYEMAETGLSEYFQTCTLKASQGVIGRGDAVRLSGVVPVQGRHGSYPGRPKYVWIYSRATARSQPPTTWDATNGGWKLVARVRTDGLGRYHSATLSPRRTTWYVARYAGDADYWRAYTSVLQVRVR